MRKWADFPRCLVTRESGKATKEAAAEDGAIRCSRPRAEAGEAQADPRRDRASSSSAQGPALCYAFTRVKAQQEGRHNKVKALQYLLTRSQSARILAVERVTENEGKKT